MNHLQAGVVAIVVVVGSTLVQPTLHPSRLVSVSEVKVKVTSLPVDSYSALISLGVPERAKIVVPESTSVA